jgi:hypothetical protein
VEHRHPARDSDQPRQRGQSLRRARALPAPQDPTLGHPIGHPHDSDVPLPKEEWTFVAQVPEVVSQEHFDLVAKKLSQNRSFARRNNKANEHLLRALVSCESACRLP